MIPDKIYVRSGTLLSNGSAEECVLPEWYEMPHIGSIDYIRKDALVEWLENKINISDGGFVNGLLCLAYKDVIEHLNEM